VEIGADARLLAVLGDPIAHSLSPVMQNAAIEALGLRAVYVAMRVPADSLGTVCAALAAVGAAGNVTVPHKEAMEGLVARKTDTAARVGACNTFWTEGGALVGDNTDVPGIAAALTELGAGGAGRWLLLGTGGSARAAVGAAGAAGASVMVRSRDPARARAFADWANSQMRVHTDVAHGPLKADVVLNATPLGLDPQDPLPCPVADLRGARVALDFVYARGETRWVRTARGAGVVAADGRELLVRQGAIAFERFFPGTRAPVDVMRAAVARALRA